MAQHAERQAGAVAVRQLRRAGLTESEVRTLRRRGTLAPTEARGVLRVVGAGRTWRQDLWVAILAGPEGTLVSHVSAAALRGLVAPPGIPQVTVPRRTSGRFRHATVHYATVRPDDRTVCDGIEATTVARAIVDCAGVLDQKALNDLVDAAFGKGLCSYRRVMEAWRRAGGRVRGGALLGAALAPYAGGAEPNSVKNGHVLRLISGWGLPLPECEIQINDANGGFLARVDFIWRPWWLILEYDGEGNHGPRRWAVDDRTQAAIEALGFRLERADRFDLRPSSTRLFDLLSGILLQPARGPWPVRPYPALGRPA